MDKQVGQVPLVAFEFLVQIDGFAVARHGEQGGVRFDQQPDAAFPYVEHHENPQCQQEGTGVDDVFTRRTGDLQPGGGDFLETGELEKDRRAEEKAVVERIQAVAHKLQGVGIGFGRFEAEDQLRAFLSGAQSRGLRAVLVITGQGRIGGGVIRASIHEWLQSAALRPIVSGFAIAHRRHGGDGAIYVTLKRR